MSEKKKANKPKKASSEKKSGAGRPTKMTESTLKKIEFAFLKGMTDEEACLFAEITPATLYNYCNANPEFFERKELLKKMPKVKAKINIVEGIENGDTELSKWYLERKAKDEFSTKQDIDVSGEINNPFEGLTTEELKKLIDDE